MIMQKSLVFIIVILFSFRLIAQSDTVIYYSPHDKVVNNISNANKYITLETKNKNRYISTQYTKSGQEWSKEILDVKRKNDTTLIIKSRTSKSIVTQFFHKVDSGYWITEIGTQIIPPANENQSLHNSIMINYKYVGLSRLVYPVIREGTWVKDRYPINLKISENYYLNNEQIGNKNWNDDGSEYISNIDLAHDADASYDNGDMNKFLRLIAQNAEYPEDIVFQGISGTAAIKWIIMEDGTIDGIQLLKSTGNKTLDNEAIKALKSLKGKWNPASIDGNPVRSSMVTSLGFTFSY